MNARVACLVAMLATGCSVQLGGADPAPLASDAVVLEYTNAGGYCPAPGCYSMRTFRADGSFTSLETPNKFKRTGKVDPALVLALRREIAKADFKALHAIDRDKICRGIADAGDATWVFTTASGKETFKACSPAFTEGEVFKAGQKLISAAYEALKDEPLPRSPFRGVWAVASEGQTKGPLEQDPCAPFRRWVFTASDKGEEGANVAVTDANQAPSRAYDREELVVRAGNRPGEYAISGTRTVPGPTDGPVKEAIRYQLTYDAAKHVATGMRYVGAEEGVPFTLIETTAAADCPTGSPAPTTAPSATPSATATPAPTTAPSFQPGDRVVVIGGSGGLCPPGVTCGQETAYQRDGRYVTTSGGQEREAGKVSEALVDALVAEIAKADFAAIKAKPFTGTCPTAYDGQEITYTFTTAGGEEKLPACTYDLSDDPLIKAAQELEQARTSGN